MITTLPLHPDGRAVASGWFGSLYLRDMDGNIYDGVLVQGLLPAVA